MRGLIIKKWLRGIKLSHGRSRIIGLPYLRQRGENIQKTKLLEKKKILVAKKERKKKITEVEDEYVQKKFERKTAITKRTKTREKKEKKRKWKEEKPRKKSKTLNKLTKDKEGKLEAHKNTMHKI